MTSAQPTPVAVRAGVAVLLMGGALLAALTLPIPDWIAAFVNWMTAAGPVGAIAFGLLYIVVTVLLLPASPLPADARALDRTCRTQKNGESHRRTQRRRESSVNH